MGPTAKAGLLVAMVALLVAGQLLERELAGRRRSGRSPSLAYPELVGPLPDVELPRRPRAVPLEGVGSATGGAGARGIEGETSYTVRSGDTLSKVARKVYGAEREWKRIYDANRSAIPDPGRLQPGTKLRIPRRDAAPRR